MTKKPPTGGRSGSPRTPRSGATDGTRPVTGRRDSRPAPRSSFAPTEPKPAPARGGGRRYDPTENDAPFIDFDDEAPVAERPARSRSYSDAPPLYGDDRRGRYTERPAKPGYSDRPARAERLGKEGPAKARPPRAEPIDRDGPYWIWGTHATQAALANPNRKVLVIAATANGAADLPATWRIDVVTPEALTKMLPPGAVHQGIALKVAPLKDMAVSDVLDRTGPVVVLDQVTDPQNVGAIFRSAAAFGARAIVQQDRKSPPITGALAKAAAGAVETVADVRVTNIARALDEMKAAGMQLVGLSADGTVALDEAFDGRPAAIVLGAEGKGVRALVAESCDVLARIPHAEGMESLNVSNAAALALYEAVRGGPNPAEAIVRGFFDALDKGDAEAAGAVLASTARITLPGGRTETTIEEMLAWRAERVARCFYGVERADSAGSVVLLQGHLRGEFLDGSPFTGVRFSAWSRVAAGKIADLRLWDDLAESVPV